MNVTSWFYNKKEKDDESNSKFRAYIKLSMFVSEWVSEWVSVWVSEWLSECDW